MSVCDPGPPLRRAVPYDETPGSIGWNVTALVEHHDRAELIYAAAGNWPRAAYHAHLSAILVEVDYRPRVLNVPVVGEVL